jgi:hypothetical protein
MERKKRRLKVRSKRKKRERKSAATNSECLKVKLEGKGSEDRSKKEGIK